MKVAIIRPGVSFGDAFREARSAGADEFEWCGRRYHTKTAEEMPADPKPSAVLRVVEE